MPLARVAYQRVGRVHGRSSSGQPPRVKTSPSWRNESNGLTEGAEPLKARSPQTTAAVERRWRRRNFAPTADTRRQYGLALQPVAGSTM